MLKAIISYTKEWTSNLWQIIRLRFKSTVAFRELRVSLSSFYSKRKSLINIFKPETVVGWQQDAWKVYWNRKSKKGDKPPISNKVKELILKIHKENPLLSSEKIHELLATKGLKDPPSPNTIERVIRG